MWYMIKSVHRCFMLKITRFFPVSDFLPAQSAICNLTQLLSAIDNAQICGGSVGITSIAAGTQQSCICWNKATIHFVVLSCPLQLIQGERLLTQNQTSQPPKHSSPTNQKYIQKIEKGLLSPCWQEVKLLTDLIGLSEIQKLSTGRASFQPSFLLTFFFPFLVLSLHMACSQVSNLEAYQWHHRPHHQQLPQSLRLQETGCIEDWVLSFSFNNFIHCYKRQAALSDSQ